MPIRKTNTDKPKKGDTSRTSSQGRKLSSGGNSDKIGDRGDREMNEETKAPVSEEKKNKPRVRH